MGREINPFELTLEELQRLDSEQFAACKQQVYEQVKDQLHAAFADHFSHVVILNGQIVEKSIAEEMSPGSLALVEKQYPGQAYYVFKSPDLIPNLENADKPVDKWLYNNTMILPKEPSTMEVYVKAIQEQSSRKGWSKQPQWLQNSIFKETVELIKAIEGNESDEKVGGEASDVLYFLWQYVKGERPNVNLDSSLIAKMHDNEIKKKKTLDETGRLVRK